ncbi:FG-GAP and VCBS repeat-containing protein [Streptomyces monticola]|uniref:FG-GAP and VCBS repeat-containing protein n=1 Tax=Streptomyces monticola TaxID=2666263 RepID=A0ABW2JET3_9ACTN
MAKHKRVPAPSPRRIRLAGATAAVAALTGGLFVSAASTATAADSVHHSDADFNNDGMGDVAYSAGNATVAGKTGAGQIVALYGSASGADSAHRKTVSQESAGIPGSAETNDAFGWVSAYGDFNGDGFDDLAVSAQLEDVSGDKDGGAVTLMWGSANGLRGGTTLKDPAASSHDKWGRALAAGDFDGDGTEDLAVGSTSSRIHVFKDGISTSGTAGGRYTITPDIQSGDPTGPLNLTAGDVNGDKRTDLVVDGYETDSEYGWNTNYYVPGTDNGLAVSGAQELKRGVITGIGDINGDGYGDIVTGQNWDPTTDGSPSIPEAGTGGKIHVIYGSAAGPAAATAIDQNSPGVPGSSERGDWFGGELSLGDINGDGRTDIVVGSEGENLAGVTNTGSVSVLYGSESGVATTGAQFFAQSTPGVPGSDEKDDYFGAEMKLTDLTGDGRADLTVGAIGENGFNGALTYLPSDGTRITTAGARSLSTTAVGVSTSGQPVFGGNAAN